ncbi:MAG TPA: TPM domain-containing protein [Stellaceae bacterium]|nr:TPM domain-containing protein [Stellaceae bacterium]
MRPLRAPALAHALAAVLVLLLAAAAAAEPVYPALTGRVVDDAGILSANTRSRLDASLAEHEQKTGQQLVVVTLGSLQGYTIEDFGYQLGRRWGIGQKGRDNGALLIVAPKERKVRIEVGYGLEGTLTDAESRIIIEQVILPQFRRGDLDAGVSDGVAAILRVLGGAPLDGAVPRARTVANAPPPWVFFVFLVLFFGFFAWRIYGAWPLLLAGRGVGPWYGSGGFSGGGFSGGGGGFSGGGGGFSGGGGSFGGGGASGGW